MSHDRVDESEAAKIAWFATLTVTERLRHLDEMVRLAMADNPDIADAGGDGPPDARVLVVGPDRPDGA